MVEFICTAWSRLSMMYSLEQMSWFFFLVSIFMCVLFCMGPMCPNKLMNWIELNWWDLFENVNSYTGKKASLYQAFPYFLLAFYCGFLPLSCGGLDKMTAILQKAFFKMSFFEWINSNYWYNSTMICCKTGNKSSGGGFVRNRQQAMTWTAISERIARKYLIMNDMLNCWCGPSHTV